VVTAQELGAKDQINVGIAVATDQALVVPVLHDAADRTLEQIAGRRQELVAAAREGRLRPADIEGGTFTISNLGMYGVDSFDAIVNAPQVAILAVGRIADRVVALDGIEIVKTAGEIVTTGVVVPAPCTVTDEPLATSLLKISRAVPSIVMRASPPENHNSPSWTMNCRSMRGAAIFASISAFLVFDWFFVQPYHQFTVSDPGEWLSLLLFLLTGVTPDELSLFDTQEDWENHLADLLSQPDSVSRRLSIQWTEAVIQEMRERES
jgi:hypothetical protein